MPGVAVSETKGQPEEFQRNGSSAEDLTPVGTQEEAGSAVTVGAARMQETLQNRQSGRNRPLCDCGLPGDGGEEVK